MSLSLIVHALLALAVGALLLKPAIQQSQRALERLELVYFNDAKPAGGGGSSPQATPPQPTQIPPHQLQQPLPVAPAVATPEPPLPTLNAPVETNAAAVLQMTGSRIGALPGPGGGSPGTGLGGDRGPGVGPGANGGPGGPAMVGGDVLGPTRIRKIDPSYTPDAMLRKIQGTVEIEAVVLANGTVGAMRVTKSLGSDLDAAAMAAARQWVFRPGTRLGKPIDVLVLLILDFRLR